MTFQWSKRPFIIGLIYSLAIFALAYLLDKHLSIDEHISFPWEPISIIGIAVAFYLGFKNNSSYDRIWEARKIWGGIVNDSRSFGASTNAFVQGENAEDIKRELIYRHIAWMTALRYQLRLSKPWESAKNRLTEKYLPTICEKYLSNLEGELANYISKEEIAGCISKTNTAVQILNKQSERVQELRDQNYIDDFRRTELNQLITSLYAEQGKAERIKNFPFPRQYASTALWLTFVFCALLPFGILDAFKTLHGGIFWVAPFISALVIWVFFLMEKIGEYSQNPFEGNYNDVPITSMSRGIEIDLREMINDKDIPKPIGDENGFLM